MTDEKYIDSEPSGSEVALTDTPSEEIPADTPSVEEPQEAFTGEPNEGAAKAHQAGEEIGRAVTGVVVTGGSFVVGLAKGIGGPIIKKISEVSRNSQGVDIGEQAKDAFDNGVKTAEGWAKSAGEWGTSAEGEDKEEEA